MKKLPTVAIIGQTNAGKSSLFNRISRSRRAIVAREEGTTRDNVMTRVEHAGSAFWLVDTAGLKDPEDDFEATIQQQIEEASLAADLILVATDSTKYPDQSDRDIAKKALKSQKPVILALNKVDLKDSLSRDEFLRLGIKDIVEVSAEHGTGISKLLDHIAAEIPRVKAAESENVLKIALIGRPNVGKSSLFNTLAKKQQAVVANLSGTTRDLNRVEIRYQGQAIEIIDTAGVRRPGKQAVGIEKFSVLRTMQAIEEADICLLLVDSNETHAQFDQKLAGIINEVGKGLVVALTKWDTIDSADIAKVDEIRAGINYDFKFVPFAPLVFTSSVSGKNVAKLLDLALQIADQRQKEVKTSDLNRALRAAVAAHPPAGLKNTFPKLRYIVQTDTAPPWFVIYGSHLKFLHWSYKRYLERTMRETFGFEGTPIKFSFREEKKNGRVKERDDR
ncbi:MAG: ribosome biogenesis GTPase Der [Candidatus Nomurabacteria bacterium]|jgi:GTP-binding protein|nr:ribosome biogenesis GTPase Der [Candidatus Nomurabacteria bacterium]